MKNKISFIVLLSLLVFAFDANAQLFKKKKGSPKKGSDSTAVAASAAPQKPAFSEDSLFVTLERTACFGHCPTYKIEIYIKGFVVYHGYNFVDRTGDFTTTLTKQQLKEIFNYAKDIRFFNMKDSYINPAITDFPTTITMMKIKSQKKTITDGHSDTPSELIFFEKLIDDTFKDTQWKVLK